MAKLVIIRNIDETISFTPTKVERARIYGSRKRVAVDANGATCTKAVITDDGAQLLASGMIAQAYFTREGRWVPRSEMVGLDAEGNTMDSRPSTLGVSQDLEGPIEPAEILGLKIESVFYLEPADCSEEFQKALKAERSTAFRSTTQRGLPSPLLI